MVPQVQIDTIVRRYNGTLAASGIVSFEAYGDFIFLRSNSGTDDTLKISFDNNAETIIPVGIILRLNKPFSRIILKNSDSASTDFVLLIGQGNIDYKALVLSGTIVTGPAQSSTGTYAADVSVTVAAQINAAGTSKRVVIQADPANTDLVHIGLDNGVLTTKKVYSLQAGQVLEISDYKGDLWAIAQAGTQKLSVSKW